MECHCKSSISRFSQGIHGELKTDRKSKQVMKVKG